ncbi:histidine phosphatase family protein [Pseudomonas edaphica]|uniref:histidine phosphatase family protein n=1 Tax=Pseudomonas edaphica TaxID=2006980 RepID=UPI0023EFB0E6|nr:histidine phosphatase family protein [Pseudomonas edaphica]
MYVRHGETDYNLHGLWMGSIDAPLNEQGRTQALNVAIELCNFSIDKIYTSPLCRAHETAMIIASRQSVSPELLILPGLQERGFGVLEGRLKTAESKKDLDSCLGVESESNFRVRLMESMSALDGVGLVLIVSHSAVFRYLVEKLNFSPIPSVDSIANCQVVELRRSVTEEER